MAALVFGQAVRWRRFALVAVLGVACLLPWQHARADEGPDVGEVVARLMGRTLLTTLRSFAEFTYDTASLPDARSVRVSGLRLVAPRNLALPGCEMRVRSLDLGVVSVAGSLLLGDGLTLDARGVTLEPSCLPPQTRGMIAIAGLDHIDIGRISIDWRRDLASGASDIALRAQMRGVASIDLDVRLDYLTLRTDFLGFGASQNVAIRFGPVRAVMRDEGLVDRIDPFLSLAGLERRHLHGRAAQQVFKQTGNSALTQQVRGAIRSFLAGSRQSLVLTLRPQAGLSSDDLGSMATRNVIAAFRPSLTNEVVRETVDPGLLAAFDAHEPDDEQRLAMARAMVEGRGAPRDPAAAVALLKDSAQGDGAALALRARARLATGKVLDEAYRDALRASAAGRSVTDLLDTLEMRLPAAVVLRLQAAAASPATDGLAEAIEAVDPRRLLDAAHALERGEGVARSFERASVGALLAAAAAEPGADRLLDRLEARASADPSHRAVFERARRTARTVWSDRRMARRLFERIRRSQSPWQEGRDSGEPKDDHASNLSSPRPPTVTQQRPAPDGSILSPRPGAGSKGITDDMGQFVATVLAETEDVWNGIFRQQGRQYPEPTLVMFTDAVRSACGQASSATGPFYCPGDSKVYLDTSFFQTLARRFDAAGDFAAAYVIAHEVGHHVQNVIGVLPKFNRMRAQMNQADANAMSVRVELQADCFAGIWAHFTDQKGLLEQGDIGEALNAAEQIGDDAIQRRTQGYVVPESFSHGTSEQRREWFMRGYESGRVAQCDTGVFG